MSKDCVVVHVDRSLYLMEWLDQEGKVAQQLIDFADLVKAPEEIYTFQLSTYAIWSAAAKGLSSDYIINTLEQYSCNEIDERIKTQIRKNIMDFGTLRLYRKEVMLELHGKTHKIINEILSIKEIGTEIKVVDKPTDTVICFKLEDRIKLKRLLFKHNLYVIDGTNVFGEPLDLNLKGQTLEGPFKLREYQIKAAEAFMKYKDNAGGGGSIIMPPWSGKTLVGLKIIESLKTNTLILVENKFSAERWVKEFSEKTDLADGSVVNFNDDSLQLQPITICTYSFISRNPNAFNRLKDINWGFIIYDDAHRLPADTYLQTTDFASQYKLALASTLARSEGNGNLVLALIGPKWFEILPRTLEQKGFQVPVTCVEIKVPLSEKDREKYDNEKYRPYLRNITAFNDRKKEGLTILLQKCLDKNIVIVSYRPKLALALGKELDIPVIRSSAHSKADKWKDDFNAGEITRLITTSVIEKIPLQRIDFLVALSYQQGSEREEYLRLGKLMSAVKGKKSGYLYSLVTEKSIEEDDYGVRRRSLINYGYRYKIITLDDIKQGEFGL